VGKPDTPQYPAVPTPAEIEQQAEEKRQKGYRGAYDALALQKQTRTDWRDMLRQGGTGLYIGENQGG